MSNIFKRYKIILLIIMIPYILVILFFTVPINYEGIVPGYVEKANNVIYVDNNLEKSTNYYSTSVLSISKITLFQKLVLSNKADSTIFKRSSITVSEDNYMGEIEHNSAIFTSIISAYNKAGIALDYEYVGTYVYYTKDPNLQIGDIVLGSSYDEVITNFNSLTFDIKRNGEIKTVTISDTKNTYLEYGAYKFNDNKNIYINKSDSQGPSAGFMQALSLYDDLIEADLSKGYKIAGTGTIDEYGNVGAIGCVDIKLYTAIYNKCDIFFVPKENYAKAKEVYDKLDTNIKLIQVESFDDAINYLGGLNEKV